MKDIIKSIEDAQLKPEVDSFTCWRYSSVFPLR